MAEMRSYGVSRTLFSFLGFCAWAVVAVGIFVTLVAIGEVSRYGSGLVTLYAAGPGLGITFTGLLTVAFVQNSRANVDTAEYTQQMLKIARDQLEVSRQGVKTGNVPASTFAETVPAKPAEAETIKVEKIPEPEVQEKPKPIPKPEPPRTIEYKGKEILIKKGKYICNGVPFNTLEKAEHYIDTYTSKALSQGE